MGRHATPWYRKDRDAWYVYHNGKQVKLAAGKANRLAAMDAFHRIMVAKPGVTTSGEGLTVREVVDAYMGYVRSRVEARSMTYYTYFLVRFVEMCTAIPIQR